MKSFRRAPIITLLTDFGSVYPAQMKGVILNEVPNATLVDIAHDISPQDVRAGAFALMTSARYFPKGTVHLAVVDPGVGTDRLGIVIESAGHLFVGPDNGLLVPAAKSLGDFVARSIVQNFEAAPTFHGRDVFAPVAAMLAEGARFEEIGPEVEPIDLNFGKARFLADGIEAQVIYVDSFGNVILNLEEIPKDYPVLSGRKLRASRTYADAARIEPLITIGGHGFAEIAVNQGSAAKLFGLQSGDRILLERANCSE